MVPASRIESRPTLRSPDLLGSYSKKTRHSLLTWCLLSGRYQKASDIIFIRLTDLQQPTSFTLNTFTLEEVFNTPALITSLADYSESRTDTAPAPDLHSFLPQTETSSLLFLQILAAADYFTTNKTLMQYVPAVNVDISKLDTLSA